MKTQRHKYINYYCCWVVAHCQTNITSIWMMSIAIIFWTHVGGNLLSILANSVFINHNRLQWTMVGGHTCPSYIVFMKLFQLQVPFIFFVNYNRVCPSFPHNYNRSTFRLKKKVKITSYTKMKHIKTYSWLANAKNIWACSLFLYKA